MFWTCIFPNMLLKLSMMKLSSYLAILNTTILDKSQSSQSYKQHNSNSVHHQTLPRNTEQHLMVELLLFLTYNQHHLCCNHQLIQILPRSVARRLSNSSFQETLMEYQKESLLSSRPLVVLALCWLHLHRLMTALPVFNSLLVIGNWTDKVKLDWWTSFMACWSVLNRPWVCFAECNLCWLLCTVRNLILDQCGRSTRLLSCHLERPECC